MNNVIHTIKVKELTGGAKVVDVTFEDDSTGTYFVKAGESIPSVFRENNEIEYTIKEVVKGNYTNKYISLGGSEKPAYNGPKAGGGGGSYGKPMDPDTQARVTRLSCLSSASNFLAGQSHLTAADVIETADIFFAYANTGKVPNAF